LEATVASDDELFGDGYGPEKIISVDVAGGRYLQIVVFHGSAAKKTEVYFKDLASDGPIRPIVNDIEARFFPDMGGDRIYLRTDWKAPRGRILAVDPKDPSKEKWREVVPQGKGSIQGFTAVAGRLFVEVLEDVVPRVRVFGADGRFEREISFPTAGSVGSVEGRWRSSETFFRFNSFVVPTTIYRYDAAEGTRSVWARQNAPVASERFVVEQVRYPSKDGTEIPMFLVHAKGLERDGRNPTLLTGYGGFSLPQTPAFSPRAAAWVERGGVYALPNLRGGGEFGEDWHKAGMLEKKQNVFDDFIAAAQWLIAKKYTSPEHLAISGGSNGGLLVGAAMTQRPELFSAVVCSYPLLDMVRYHKFLVAGYWVPEYGSAENREQFRFIREYSPYQNVEEGAKYPAVLFITGDSDTRVDPLHARKMAALLQATSGSDPAEEPILLHYDTKAGHSRGATPVTKQIQDLTDELSFLLWQTGVKR
jgi:prolyl oligopeptidase